jgi:trk system potassium uptake protein
MINFKVVSYFQGILLVIESLVIFLAGIVSFIYHDGDTTLIIASSFLTGFVGFFLWALFMDCDKKIGKREGYLVVALSWITCSLFGALPFYLTGKIPYFTDAFFESVSGFTTTGMTVVPNVELLSHGLLFWRSLTQWLGGIGFIVLTLSVMPLLGISGMNLFMLDITGQPIDKLHSRFKESVKKILFIYVIITLVLAILLIIGEMPVFDSICHSFSTISTGGFSTKQNNIGFYESPYIQYVLIVFMIIAGANFSLSYLVSRMNFRKIWQDEEFRAYLTFIAFFVVVMSIILITSISTQPVEKSIRDSVFQVVSVISTTGYVTTNYLQWAPSAIVVIVLMMLLGASSSSTGGGTKVIRIVILIKNGVNEFRRLIHPNAIIPVRIEGEGIKPDIITNVLVFISLYIFLMIFGILVISFLGYDMNTSIGTVLASIGNIGPGIGNAGPFTNFSEFSIFGKWFLSLLMIFGRLELISVIVLFTPTFWRR